MKVELGNIDAKLLKRQTEFVSELSESGLMNTDEKELLTGVWNLLGAIRDQVDPEPSVAPEYRSKLKRIK